MEEFDHVISACGLVSPYVFENHYVHEVLDYSSIEGMDCLVFQVRHRFEMYISSRI